MRINLNIVMIFVLLCGGCTRLRFVVDAIPADDELTESIVLGAKSHSLFDEPTAKIALIDLTGLIADARRSVRNARTSSLRIARLSRGGNSLRNFQCNGQGQKSFDWRYRSGSDSRLRPSIFCRPQGLDWQIGPRISVIIRPS